MAPHCSSYCLKHIATKPGIKRHITQSPACRDHWKRVVERAQFAVTNDKDDQFVEVTNDDTPSYDWMDDFDDNGSPDSPLNVPEGNLVHHSHIDVHPGPPDLCKPSSKHARVEQDDEDSPHWPLSGHFTEHYPGMAATILGKEKTVFKSQEAAELERGNSEWAPFCDEDEWEFAHFLMKNLGKTKIDELLKLSSVSE